LHGHGTLPGYTVTWKPLKELHIRPTRFGRGWPPSAILTLINVFQIGNVVIAIRRFLQKNTAARRLGRFMLLVAPPAPSCGFILALLNPIETGTAARYSRRSFSDTPPAGWGVSSENSVCRKNPRILGCCEPMRGIQDFPEQIAGHGDFCHLVCDTPTVR
jgi:hypothetical protein